MKRNSLTKIIPLLFFILLTENIFCPACHAALDRKPDGIKAGCAKVNITPPVGVWLSGYGSRNKPSDNIVDELYAKALVLDDGQNKIAIVSADLLWVTLEITDEIRRIVKQKTGIPESNVLICATHTHFGPKVDKTRKDWPDTDASRVDESYIQTLKNKIAGSVFTAAQKSKAVKLGVVKGEIPEIVYNRRTKRPDGKVVNTFRLPPADPNLVFGPVDPEVGIIRIEDANGAIVGTVVNYACHPVCGATDNEEFYSISADYPGYTAQVVEQMEGGICLFALGTAGDMNPYRIEGENHRSRIGKALGAEVLRRLQFDVARQAHRFSETRDGVIQAAFENFPRQFRGLFVQSGLRHVVRLVLDVRTGVDREHREPGFEAGVDVVGGLEVVGVRAEAFHPAFLQNAEHRVGHHVFRRTPRAAHLANRLLGEYGPDARVVSCCPDVSGRRKAEPVSHSARSGNA